MSHTEGEIPANPVQLSDASAFEAVVAAYDVVLVDFYANWCGPCQMMEPAIETVAAETDAAVLKVDVDQFQTLAGRFGVQSIPTLFIVAGGEPAERLVGMQTVEGLTNTIEGYTE